MIWGVVRTSFEGLHFWRHAPPAQDYLRNLHRHVFHVELQVEQNHDDRDIEYHALKQWVDGAIKMNVLHDGGDLGESSCEQIALKLKSCFETDYPGRRVKVMVFEDGENGALID